METVLQVDETACRAKLQELSQSFSLLESLVSVTKKNETPAVLSDTIRFFGQFLSYFLGPCWAFLKSLLVSMGGEVVFAVKIVQRSTRQIQSLCAHAKITRNSAILAYVPKIKKQLEQLIYLIRETLKKAGAEDAFWMGNLKNRYLNGEEVDEERDLGIGETGETGETKGRERRKGRKREREAVEKGKKGKRRVKMEELVQNEAMEVSEEENEENEENGEASEGTEASEASEATEDASEESAGNEEKRGKGAMDPMDSMDSHKSKKLRKGNEMNESSESSESSDSSDSSDSQNTNEMNEESRVCNNHALKSPSVALHSRLLSSLLARLSLPRALRVPLLLLEVAHRRGSQISPLLLHVLHRSLRRNPSPPVPSDRKTRRNRAANAASRRPRSDPRGSESKASTPSLLSAR